MPDIPIPRTVASPSNSEMDHDECAEALELIFENLCEQARDAGWTDVAIGTAIVKLGGRFLKEAIASKDR